MFKKQIYAVAGGSALFGIFFGLCVAGLFHAGSGDLAAWVQGLGSVAAIFAAIWIDQGAARRLRADRDQDRRERRAAVEGAMTYCYSSVRNAAAIIQGFKVKPNQGHGLGAGTRRAVTGALASTRYHLAQPGLGDAGLIAALNLIEQRLGTTTIGKGGDVAVFSEAEQEKVFESLDGLAADIESIINEYKAGV